MTAGTAVERRGARRLPWTLVAAAALLVHGLLLGGALAAVPPGLRVLLGAAVLVLAPGAALLRLGLVPPGGPLFAAGWALGFGVAWNAALVLVARALGHPVTGLEAVAWWASLVLWAAALIVPAPPLPAGMAKPGRLGLALVTLAALGATLFVARLGPREIHMSDGPDHLGTIRRIVLSGDAFPEDAFFRDAGPAGVDPRKGVWHPQVAMVSRLAAVDPLDAWRGLQTLVAPLFILNVAALGLLAGRGGAPIAAWAFLLTYGGTIEQTPLRDAAFSSRLAEQCALAATCAVIADLAHPHRRWRIAAMLLAFAGVTSHLFAVVQIAVPLGALGLALLIRDRGFGVELRRLLMTSLAIAAASAPFLIWRAGQAYAPVNEIHTEPQGLLYLTDALLVISPGFLWTTFSWTWVLVPLLWVAVWKLDRHRPMALWMMSATLAAWLTVLNPLLAPLLEPRVGYLMPRFLGFVPAALWLAWGLPRAWAQLVAGPGRQRAALALAVMAVTLGPAVRDAFAIVPNPGRIERAESPHDVMRWRDALDWMRAELPADAVVLSDPATSYTIPMMAGRYVVTLVDQHSSPNDPHALDRILDARDALDPFSTWDRVREVVDAYGVDAVALNDRFGVPPLLDYWGPDPEWFAQARQRFDAHPDAFPPLFDTGDFVVYGVDRAALELLRDPPPPRHYVETWRDHAYPAGRQVEPGLPALHGVRLASASLVPGDTLRAVALWRSPAPAVPGSYKVAVRLDRPLPEGFRPPAFLGKPWRKLLEKLNGERYRIRSNHLPVGGAYGVDLWGADEVVLDGFDTPIPRDTAPGDYVLRIRMFRQPHYPNYRLSDWFFDEDLFSGVPVATVHIAPEEARDVRH